MIVKVGVIVGVGVSVGVNVMVGVDVMVGVYVAVAVAVWVGVSVGVGVAVANNDNEAWQAEISTLAVTTMIHVHITLPRLDIPPPRISISHRRHCIDPVQTAQWSLWTG